MAFFSQNVNNAYRRFPCPESTPAAKRVVLPPVLRQRDLALFTILLIIVTSDIHGLQFAGPSALFYCVLAFVVLLVPSMSIFGWLLRRAPARVSVYTWIVRCLDDRWRLPLLFLRWWSGLLGIFAALVTCISVLQRGFPHWFHTFPMQALMFDGLLCLGTLLACLPLRWFKRVLWACGLCYLAYFGLIGSATLVYLWGPHPPLMIATRTVIPENFSWSFFGLALFALFGLDSALFLDGEMRGPHRFLRHSTRFLWWGGMLSFLALLVSVLAWTILEPERHRFLFQLVTPVFGPGVTFLAWALAFLGSFGILLVYLLVVSRISLLAAQQRCLPGSLARLNRAGTPVRAFFAQAIIIFCTSLFFAVLVPIWLSQMISLRQLHELEMSAQYGLLDSIVASLGMLFSALLFVFALWVFSKRHQILSGGGAHFLLPALCVVGCLASLISAFAPLTPDWSALFLANRQHVTLVFIGVTCSFVLAWLVSELPRRSELVREKTIHLAHERALRAELQRTYTREHALHSRLQNAYEGQRKLLYEVSRLYEEQARAAVIDPITGLLNHRAFVQRLDEELALARQQLHSFVLVFLDLDHFKAINDTWGHLAGDAVLREVALRLTRTLEQGDVVGRYGGEEFTIILAGATLADAPARVELLHQTIRTEPYLWQHDGEERVEMFVTASFGVAAFGVHGTLREELIEKADHAMYRAKLAGRDCVYLAEGQMPLIRSTLPDTQHVRSPIDMERLAGSEYELSQASTQTLQALTVVMQARDPTTGAHSTRLSELAEATGQALGADSDDLLLMRLGGLVHDIGKVGIPDAILNKPGALNEEEWAVMQQHPMIGAHILEGMGGFFRRLAPIVLAHHERWDGYGYPQGLRREEIPLSSRVLSVVDSYDAMVSRRPYKDPIPVSAARAELRRCSGSQFDPVVVQAFLNVLDTAAASGQIMFPLDPDQARNRDETPAP